MWSLPAERFYCNTFNAVSNVIGQSWRENGRIKFFITALGIFISFLIVGIFQERIMRNEYEDDDGHKERFKYATSLVTIQFIFSYTFIKVFDLISPEEEDTTNFFYYSLAGAANAISMVAAYMALEWVTFPMQVIFKSAKPVSIMILGLIFCKRYPFQRYIFVLLIVIGVVMFKYFEEKEIKPPKKSSSDLESMDYHQFFGPLLLTLSLAMDGILGVIQDKIKDKYSPTFRQLMIGMTGIGAIFLIVVVIAMGEIKNVFEFMRCHSEILWQIFIYATCGVIGQIFIFIMVSSFGSLACSVTTTVRKFFSVLFSIIFFQNPSTLLQWIGAILVFIGLFADAFYGQHSVAEIQITDTQDENSTSNSTITEAQENNTKEMV